MEGLPPLVLTEHLNWHQGLPIPDWPAIYAWLNASTDESTQNTAYSACQRAWLLHLAEALEPAYHLVESDRGMVLSSLEPQVARATLAFMERTLKRISWTLDGVAKIPPYGKDILIVLDEPDDYYRYVSHCYPEDGEFAFSGGMYISAGYGHFVTIKDDLSRIEPVIAHEMTHACLAHLRLPLWINEGLAVNTEHKLAGRGASLWTPQEMREKHLRFWGEAEIQEFWSGISFQRPDDGNPLSYDLARILVAQLARDWPRFRQFAVAAEQGDGGARAACEAFGVSLGQLFATLFEKEDAAAFEPQGA